MNSRALLNLGLLVVILVLGLVAWLRPGIEAEPEPRLLTDIDEDTVSSIEIVRKDEHIRFVRRDTQWFVDGDPELPADPLQVSSLLRLGAAEMRRHYPAGTLDLAALDLDPAPITVTFDEIELGIGGTEPLENLRYVRTGDTVGLVQDTFHTMLKGKRTNFASRRLLPEGSRIESIALPGLTLSRDSDGHWQLEPEQGNVSADTLQKLVDAWAGAQALWVANATDTPEDSETVTITLAGHDTPITWQLVSADNTTSLTRTDLGLKYEIGSGLGDQLLKLPDSPAEDAPATGE